ncbi:hypothetical protein LR48_Vigan05g067600 [Vigna angularis]|uniref:ABSCISIC ACID-INSENSITIVE 5-like protein n=2 Tax=Phaseolus angularis TaxID=3914 RepID=A0A0L9UKI6_PHAAN|nr:ABSCISIC ACID-INSENSITIVE 5-like protein [Vigna angularis]KOM43072.1 hypothetical protein LR48_Vigan05g067600 [Vigna angularis]
MECQDGGDKNEKHLVQQPLVRQNSLYGLTLNEVENELGERGKPVSSMNLDELLKIVYTVEENHSTKAGLSLTSSLCMKTVDEVWRDIQESKDNKFEERQLRLGDIKLADFLVKAGVVVEASSTVVNPQQPQYQIPQQGLMGIYMTGQNIAQSLHTRATATS